MIFTPVSDGPLDNARVFHLFSNEQVDLSDLMERVFLEKIPDDEPVISYAPSCFEKLKDIVNAQSKE